MAPITKKKSNPKEIDSETFSEAQSVLRTQAQVGKELLDTATKKKLRRPVTKVINGKEVTIWQKKPIEELEDKDLLFVASVLSRVAPATNQAAISLVKAFLSQSDKALTPESTKAQNLLTSIIKAEEEAHTHQRKITANKRILEETSIEEQSHKDPISPYVADNTREYDEGDHRGEPNHRVIKMLKNLGE